MLATLKGVISEKYNDTVVLDVRGVGYGVLMTASDQGTLHTGAEVKVYVYEHIRENTHDLYGFTSLEDKQFFELLLEVNGVGPRMALNILSIGSLREVRKAIAGGDTKYIQSAHGVGKRVAERVVVDLKDKVGLAVGEGAEQILVSSAVATKDEAVQALVALGYSLQDAATALAGIDANLSVEERVKQALKGSTL